MTTIPEDEMPAPRLELRWVDKQNVRDGYVYSSECVYSLVLKLGEYDIRRESCDDEGNDLPKVDTVSILMGGTFSTGNASSRYLEKDDRVVSPYRDGAHAGWDTKQLGNLPVYLVSCGRAMLTEPRP